MTPAVMPQAQAFAGLHPDQSGSWMAPEAKSSALLYATNSSGNVTVYTYPQGKLVGKLKGFYRPDGECVDRAGNVYVADGVYVYEYAHGGTKRLKTLDAPAETCSIDPTSGDLAVAGGHDSLAIFKNASGSPKRFKIPGFYEANYCAYDDKGDVLVNGQNKHYGPPFVLALLAKGSGKPISVSLDQSIGGVAGMQWDGKYWAIGDGGVPVIYQFTINGNQGTKEGATRLGSGVNEILQFVLDGSRLIVPNEQTDGSTNVLFFNYPVGGTATKAITRGIFGAFGAVVSRPASS